MFQHACNWSSKKRGKREKSREKFWNKIVESLTNLVKNMNLQTQETQQMPKIIMKRTIPRHIIVILLKAKDKEKILKTEREKWLLTDTRNPNNRTADFPSETMAYRRQWDDIYETLEVGSRELFRFPIIFQK